MTNTLTAEQIAQGWIAYTGNLALDKVSPLAYQIMNVAGWVSPVFIEGDNCPYWPEVIAYRILSPDLPRPSESESLDALEIIINPPATQDWKSDALYHDAIACVRKALASLPSLPVSGEAAAWNCVYPTYGHFTLKRHEAEQAVKDGAVVTPLFTSPLTNEPVGVTLPADLARCLLVENNQHEKHLLQWTEGRATNKLDEYINLLKQSRDRLSAAIGERG